MARSVPAYQPPRTRSGEFWRAVGCLLIGGLAWAETLPHHWQDHRAWVWAGLALGAISLVAVRWRREYPLTVVVLTNVLSIFSGAAAGPASLAIVSVATRRRYGELAVVTVVSIVSGMLFTVVPPASEGEPWFVGLSFNIIVTVAVVGWGMFLGSRRELVWTLRRRAETAETEQALRVSQARLNERRRIAREMHDVLAHRISQISLHAGAIGFREDLTAEEMRTSVGVIREKAHEALTDLRAVLGVLRDAGGELGPQPTYADIGALVADARRDGLEVDYQDGIADGDEVPDPVGRTLFRIVQEGITNARKHAPGARLQIRLAGCPGDGISVELRNRLGFATSTPGSGLGLVGLAERAELAGGRLEHETQSGSFVLRGWIPWSP